MNLRPHHILCIQKFTGHGYDTAFTEHMTAVVAALKQSPQTEITLTQGCDDLCERCPNQKSGVCTSLEKVDRMDRGVLTVCGITYGERIPWAELARRGRERIFETDEFNNICDTCQWFRLCRNTEVPR